MENRKLLTLRGRSTIRKAQALFGLAGGLATIVFTLILPHINLGLSKDDFLTSLLVGIFFLLLTPSHQLAGLVGFSQQGVWMAVLPTLINALCGVIVGTALGGFLTLLRKNTNKRNAVL